MLIKPGYQDGNKDETIKDVNKEIDKGLYGNTGRNHGWSHHDRVPPILHHTFLQLHHTCYTITQITPCYKGASGKEL